MAQASYKQAPAPVPAPADGPTVTPLPGRHKMRLASRLRVRLVRTLEGWIARHSPHGDRPFFELEDFPWASTLEANWGAIREELEQLLTDHERLPNFQDISKDQRYLTQDNRWKTFFLYGYGYRIDHNCVRCPKTTQLVESVPGMMTAFFSILGPDKHIPPHRGPYKGVLRYHLGVIVPDSNGGCRIRVGDEYRNWQEGKSLVFDDSFNHEAWNESDGVRVVLFLDIVRPLPAPLSWLNQLTLSIVRRSPFVQDALKKIHHLSRQ